MIVCNSLFDRDHLMFCKSGILTFVFAENYYSIYAHAMLIKNTFAPSELWSPCLSFFLSIPSFCLSVSLYFLLVLWSAEAR